MSVGSIIGGGFRLIRSQPQVIAIWGVLFVIGVTAYTLAMRPFMASMMQVQQQRTANAAAGITTAPIFPAAAFGSAMFIGLIFSVLLVMAFAAVVRAVAQPAEYRFAYLRLGMDELRLIGLGFILAILGLILEIIAVIVIGIVGALSAVLLGKIGAGIGAGIGVIAFLCVVVYAEVRISLAGALTVMQGRIVIKDAWRVTKGHFWTLFGAYLVMSLIYLAISLVIMEITSPHLLSAYAGLNLPAIQAATQQQYAAQSAGFSFNSIIRIVVGAIIAVPFGVVLLGGIATAAFELTSATSTIAAEFD